MPSCLMVQHTTTKDIEDMAQTVQCRSKWHLDFVYKPILHGVEHVLFSVTTSDSVAMEAAGGMGAK